MFPSPSQLLRMGEGAGSRGGAGPGSQKQWGRGLDPFDWERAAHSLRWAGARLAGGLRVGQRREAPGGCLVSLEPGTFTAGHVGRTLASVSGCSCLLGPPLRPAPAPFPGSALGPAGLRGPCGGPGARRHSRAAHPPASLPRPSPPRRLEGQMGQVSSAGRESLRLDRVTWRGLLR